MISVGIDASTATGIVGLQPNRVTPAYEREIVFKDLTGYRRSKALAEAVVETMTEIKTQYPDVIVIEDYALGPNPKTIITVIEIGTLIRHYVLTQFPKIPVWLTKPASLKKFATDKGAAKKGDMIAAVAGKGWAPPTDNVADAYLLATMGLALTGKIPNLTASQRECIGLARLLQPRGGV